MTASRAENGRESRPGSAPGVGVDERYARQAILPEIGLEGRRRLAGARVAVVGLGATGSHSAALLARAGVGFLRLIDRDLVERSNLQRQALYTEVDARERRPKAVAARARLAAVNATIEIEGVNDHLSPRNIDAACGDVDLVVDGTDNMETRYLLNDFCVKTRRPWIYGGALGTSGMGMLIPAGGGPCLRCLFPEAPAPGRLGTCETAGVLGAVPALIGAWQAAAAVRWIVSGRGSPPGRLLTVDLWSDAFHVVVAGVDPDCPTCGRGEFPYLEEEVRTTVVALCGEGAFLVCPPEPRTVDLAGRAASLAAHGEVDAREHVLIFRAGGRAMILFRDGRARLKGMSDAADALSFYARYVGM